MKDLLENSLNTVWLVLGGHLFYVLTVTYRISFFVLKHPVLIFVAHISYCVWMVLFNAGGEQQ